MSNSPVSGPPGATTVQAAARVCVVDRRRRRPVVSHPIVAAATDVRARLKAVGATNPTFMSTQEKADALRELVAAEAQLVELRFAGPGRCG